jgi:hypothetical protein
MMKIAVIGAGPAGIFTTSALYRRFGDTIKIDLFGDPDCAQFHTFVDPLDPSISFDVGTCYLHHGYSNSLVPIIEELGMTLNYENDSPFTVGASVMNQKSLLDTLLLSGVFAYLEAHRQLWLHTRNVVPAVFAVPASVYLAQAGLQILLDNMYFNRIIVAQGYGWFDQICADRFFE